MDMKYSYLAQWLYLKSLLTAITWFIGYGTKSSENDSPIFLPFFQYFNIQNRSKLEERIDLTTWQRLSRNWDGVTRVSDPVWYWPDPEPEKFENRIQIQRNLNTGSGSRQKDRNRIQTPLFWIFSIYFMEIFIKKLLPFSFFDGPWS